MNNKILQNVPSVAVINHSICIGFSTQCQDKLLFMYQINFINILIEIYNYYIGQKMY